MRAPTPLTASSASIERRPEPRHLAQRRVVEDDVRRHAARPRDLEPHRAQALEEIAIDVLPRLGLDARLARAARLCRGGRCRASVRSGQLVLVLQQRHALSPSASAPDTRRRSAAAGRVRRAARCSRGPRPTDASGSRPNVLSLSCPRGEHLLGGAARAARWRRAWRRTAGRRARRTTESCARARPASRPVSSSSRQKSHGAAAVLRPYVIAEVLGQVAMTAADARSRSAPSAAAAPWRRRSARRSARASRATSWKSAGE